MSTTTTNYGFVKPELTDPVSPRPFNESFDMIDAALKEIADIMAVSESTSRSPYGCRFKPKVLSGINASSVNSKFLEGVGEWEVYDITVSNISSINISPDLRTVYVMYTESDLRKAKIYHIEDDGKFSVGKTVTFASVTRVVLADMDNDGALMHCYNGSLYNTMYYVDFATGTATVLSLTSGNKFYNVSYAAMPMSFVRYNNIIDFYIVHNDDYLMTVDGDTSNSTKNIFIYNKKTQNFNIVSQTYCITNKPYYGTSPTNFTYSPYQAYTTIYFKTTFGFARFNLTRSNGSYDACVLSTYNNSGTQLYQYNITRATGTHSEYAYGITNVYPPVSKDGKLYVYVTSEANKSYGTLSSNGDGTGVWEIAEDGTAKKVVSGTAPYNAYFFGGSPQRSALCLNGKVFIPNSLSTAKSNRVGYSVLGLENGYKDRLAELGALPLTDLSLSDVINSSPTQTKATMGYVINISDTDIYLVIGTNYECCSMIPDFDSLYPIRV